MLNPRKARLVDIDRWEKAANEARADAFMAWRATRQENVKAIAKATLRLADVVREMAQELRVEALGEAWAEVELDDTITRFVEGRV